MKKILLLCGMLLALTATVASAAGVNLGWDNCVGLGGGNTKAFACNTNTGSATMVASVRAPAGIVLWTSFETYIDFQSNAAVYPAWWQLRNQTGQTLQCRNGSLAASADFTGAPYNADPSRCADVYLGNGGGGISAYTLNNGNRASLKLTFAVGSSFQAPLDANTEYFSARATVNYLKTVGSTACAGCQDGVCINLLSVRVLQPAGTPGGNVDVTTPAENSFIMWQSPTAETCHGATPAKSTTWGSVKALYR